MIRDYLHSILIDPSERTLAAPQRPSWGEWAAGAIIAALAVAALVLTGVG